MRISALLIDDDPILRSGMKGLLSMVAPEVEIVAEAEDVQSGIAAIEKWKPQLIFLDIQLNDGTGFDVLEHFTQSTTRLESQVVFITAHEQYAVKAFRFSALDYLLKPVDPDDLRSVIEKVKKSQDDATGISHVELLLENIKRQTNSFKRIALTNSDGIHLFEIADIIRCESEDNYTTFYIRNNKPVLVSRTLKEFEELLRDHGFVRIHQSHLINLTFLKSYVKKNGGYVIMADQTHLPISQRNKERLQELITKTL
ncbi:MULTISPECIES: LytR/AlgR family response regulator transcription factor [Flavobacterium]|uniref:Response regulator transcription factor n=1 Tax=Flavobacterium stagni TaxID=2506421 RepID=A0A4Q1K7V2_9FLAO|nr:MULTISPECIES: LytTR family DNA-binding domain-containing protein [Flavobacterium]RXR21908.1 response regulator transcription factor [Flavobacterium stagni]